MKELEKTPAPAERGHSHSHSHAHAHSHGDAEGGIKTAFFLNAAFVLIEFFGGLFTGSVAILSDSVHDLGDCLAIACAWGLEKRSKKAPDEKYTLGYRRFSVLSAVITALVLIIGSAGVIWASVRRMADPREIRGAAMLIIAVFGLVINGAAVLRTRKGAGKNERVISLHLLEDVLGWAAVLAGSVFIWLFDFWLLDPILSLCVGIYVLVRAVICLADALPVFLERSPGGFDRAGCLQAVLALPGAAGAHGFCSWSPDGEAVFAEIHVETRPGADVEELFALRRAAADTLAAFGAERATIQLDPPGGCGAA